MSNSEIQTIERIKSVNERAQKANTRIIQLNTQKEQVLLELDVATKESIQQFGTADVDGLREIWRQKSDEKTREILAAEKSVYESEQIILEIDKALVYLDSQNNG
ncbi:hypothetical protein [Psychromonas sp. SP041]|uniref:hypothetical protein n=1 Tax=Psychromonas sp. SP041 TaxID=1365007 RepID=UPI0010C7B529|nr:hypothetical protein [Psychromonas sp. SP041]